jgi:hypothetical protein
MADGDKLWEVDITVQVRAATADKAWELVNETTEFNPGVRAIEVHEPSEIKEDA